MQGFSLEFWLAGRQLPLQQQLLQLVESVPSESLGSLDAVCFVLDRFCLGMVWNGYTERAIYRRGQ